MYSAGSYNDTLGKPRKFNSSFGPYTFKKPNVSGAEKRRRKLAKLKAEGITDPNAYLQVRYPRKVFRSTNNNSTRVGPGPDSTLVKSELEQNSIVNKMVGDTVQSAPLESKLLKSKNVAIVPQNYPIEFILKDKLNVFRDFMGTFIDGLPDNDFLPKLHTIWSNTGSILAFCEDLQTREWLTSNITKIKPWDGTDLKVIDTGALAEKITLWVPGPKIDTDSVLKRIKRQNDGLEVTSWYLIERKEEEDGLNLELVVDKESFKNIMKKSGKLYCGAVRAIVKTGLNSTTSDE